MTVSLGGRARSGGPSMAEDDDFEVVVVDDDEIGDFAELGPARLLSSYCFGRSHMNEEVLDGYVEDGLISLKFAWLVRLLDGKRSPRPNRTRPWCFVIFSRLGCAFLASALSVRCWKGSTCRFIN